MPSQQDISSEKQRIKERLKILKTLWEAIFDMDEFTDNEKDQIQCEMYACETKLMDLDHEELCCQVNSDCSDHLHVRERVLGEVFEHASGEQYDLMDIFVPRQRKLKNGDF